MLSKKDLLEQNNILAISSHEKKKSYAVGSSFFFSFVVICAFLYIDVFDVYKNYTLQTNPNNLIITNYSKIINTEENITCSCDPSFLNDKYTGKKRKIFTIGFPKAGTSSLYHLFKCIGFKSIHFYKQGGTIGKLIYDAYNKNLSLLYYLSEYEAFSQLDDTLGGRNYWPQLDLFEELDIQYPNSLFILNYRNITNHYLSMKKYHSMLKRFTKLNITGLPEGKGNKFQDFERWVVQHYYKVENYFISINQKERLLILNIESINAEKELKDFFHCKKLKWDKHNAQR